MRTIALVVPCFDEETRLDPRAFVEARLPGHRLELIFVDDGSRDGTRRLIEGIRSERGSDAIVLAFETNRGKAEAVRRGVLDALTRSPYAVGFWDADLSTPFTELPSFIEVLSEHAEVDIVIGSRVKLMGRTIERRAWRHYAGRVFATAASVTLDLPVYDTQCGAKLFRATPLVGRVFEQPFASKWAFDVEIIARFLDLDPLGREHARRALHELPLRRWTHTPGSKLKAVDFARVALDLAAIYARHPRPRER